MADKHYKDVNGVKVEMDADEVEYHKKMAEEWEASKEERGYAHLRVRRNDKLSATDFHAVADREMSDEMKLYRQQLRDLPKNTPNPYSITWPSEPSN